VGTRIRSSAVLLLLVTPIAGCSSSTGPDLSVAHGTYALESVDGVPLPVPFEGGFCPREIHKGTLYLGAGRADQAPLYVYLAELRIQCDPTFVLPPDRAYAIRDNGRWTLLKREVVFRSILGFGTYSIPVEESAPGAQGPLLSLEFNSGRYTFRRTSLP